MLGRLFRITNSLRTLARSFRRIFGREGGWRKDLCTCPGFRLPSGPLISAVASVLHNRRTEVRDYDYALNNVGYCARLERPLDKRKEGASERKGKRKSGKGLE